MNEGKIHKVEGIIIKRKNYGEADRILTVFSKTLGKIQVKATGVRKITSRRSAHIELLNLSILSLYKGKIFMIVTEAQTLDNYSLIKENLRKVGFAYYACELVDRLCAENQEHRGVFSLLTSFLNRLPEEENEALLVNEFEIALLKELGFYPRLAKMDVNASSFIENILERRLRSKRLIARFI